MGRLEGEHGRLIMDGKAMSWATCGAHPSFFSERVTAPMPVGPSRKPGDSFLMGGPSNVPHKTSYAEQRAGWFGMEMDGGCDSLGNDYAEKWTWTLLSYEFERAVQYVSGEKKGFHPSSITALLDYHQFSLTCRS